MRTLTAILCLTFAVLLFSAGEGFALPPCPEDSNQHFHNCFGTYTYADGGKYVGEWRNGKRTQTSSASAALNKWLKPLVPEGCVVHSFKHSLRDSLRAVECPADIVN